MKKSTFLKVAICYFTLSFLYNFSFGQTPIGVELIPNGSFESGATPTDELHHPIVNNGSTFNSLNALYLNYWTPGYTEHPLVYLGNPTPYGGLSILYDYNAGIYGNCRFNATPNDLGGSSGVIQPQHGNRFIELWGGNDLDPNVTEEGSSVMTEFQNTTTLCNGTYTLSFWAKATDFESNSGGFCSPGVWLWTALGSDPDNKIEVVLRIAGDVVTEFPITTTPNLVPATSYPNSTPWVNYTATFTLTPAQAATFNRIEFRVSDDGGIVGVTRQNLLDNVSLKYNGPAENVYQNSIVNITCGDRVDLDDYKLIDACGDPAWFDMNGSPVPSVGLYPTESNYYRGICYYPNGCYKGEIQVYVNVAPFYYEAISVTICGDETETITSPCPLEGATDQYILTSQLSIPQDIGSPMQFTVGSTTTDFKMVTEYSNGCKCEYDVDVTTQPISNVVLEETIDMSCDGLGTIIFPVNIFYATVPDLTQTELDAIVEEDIILVWDDGYEYPSSPHARLLDIDLISRDYEVILYYNGCAIGKIIYHIVYDYGANEHTQNHTLCYGESVTLYPYIGDYDCSIYPTTGTVSNGCIHTITPPAGNSTYQLVWKDEDGECHRATHNFNTSPEIPITTTEMGDVCDDACYNLQACSYSTFNSIVWSTGETTEQITYCPNYDNEIVTVKCYLAGSSCPDEIHHFNFGKKVTANQTTTNMGDFCEGLCFDLEACPDNSGISEYLWSTNETSRHIIFCPTMSGQSVSVNCYDGTSNCPEEVHTFNFGNVTPSVPVNNYPATSQIYTLCYDEIFDPPYQCPQPSNAIIQWKLEVGPNNDYYYFLRNTTPTGGISSTYVDENGNVVHPPYIPVGFNAKLVREVIDPNTCETCIEEFWVMWGTNEDGLSEDIEGSLYDNESTTTAGHIYSSCDECFTIDWKNGSPLSIPNFRPDLCDWSVINTTNNSSSLSGITISSSPLIQLCPEEMDLATGINEIRICFECTNDEANCIAENFCITISISKDACKKGGAKITSVTVNGEEIYSQSVNVYPNPSTGIFTLELTGYNLDNTSYTIVDAVGREIMKTDNIANAASTIDLSKYEKGIYFIRIQEGEAITTKKIIIQ